MAINRCNTNRGDSRNWNKEQGCRAGEQPIPNPGQEATGTSLGEGNPRVNNRESSESSGRLICIFIFA